jgi:acyl transferase domain-containing protein/SAM-dependent methyltransferase
MSELAMSTEVLSPVKRALLEIRELKLELARSEEALREPLAIVGMAFRFPGHANDADSFMRLLWSGTDAITGIPGERWHLESVYADDPDAPGKMTTRYGGFIDEIDRFDAGFFGISPREAASMDPQQRLLLEVAWHALEDAGHASVALTGSRAGVYLGICNNDYGRALFAHPETIDVYFSTGNASSVASGRLSYFLGLHGPSITIDTACSSSLVALHLAGQGLRLRECDLALVGGVNLILTPEMNMCFSRARMMAADGRCKTFDAAADGYVRSEGCAVIVLRRLADALADGDRVLAVVRGSAVNQDGRSGGLTAPNGPAQEDVIRAALVNAGVAGREIGYVETHGTGTPLGDPIEVGALAAVLGKGRDQARPLAIGSVKTNLGHLEAAAGLAGIIKVVLALSRQEIPPHLHFRTRNPMIDWTAPITVPTIPTPWAAIGGHRFAGVSSFGFSGTNAHAIIQEAPPVMAAADATDRPLHVLALSARDKESLADLASRYEGRLEGETAIADLCYTANAGRSHFEHRLAVAGANAHELKRGLASFRKGDAISTVATGRVTGASRPQVAFLFTGQGAQSAGMARGLYLTSPVFRQALDACADGMSPYLSPGLIEVMFGGEASQIDETVYAQPATFALEYALARLWRSWGIEPVAVLGHSLGEYAAACVAGLCSLQDGLRMVAERGRLSQELPGSGAMGAVFAPDEVVRVEMARHSGAVSIAAYNGPEHVVVSGERAGVEDVLGRFEAQGIRVKMLRVSYAGHSGMVEPALPSFRKTLETVRWQVPRIAIVSNVSGTFASFEELARADYWLAHFREPVRFAQSIRAVMSLGITHFVEIGPHPVLLGMGADNVPAGAVEWLPSLRRDRPDWSDLLDSLQRLYVGGAEVDWGGFDREHSRRRVAAPTYPFRRKRHWMDLVGQPTGGRITAAERWSRLTQAAARQAESGPLDLNASSYPGKWDLLAKLTSAHARQILRNGGLFVVAGEQRTLHEVLAAARIDTRYQHLVQRWLKRLVGEGTLRDEGGTYVAVSPVGAPRLEALWAEAERLFFDNQPLLAYVRHCGNLVAKVLTGVESPLETLFPGGSWDLAEGLYERSTTMRYVNGLAASALDALATSTPAGRTLRVMEIGAGTGGTTSSLLPVLSAGNTRYRFTDVSDLFLDRAKGRFAAFPFVEYSRLDMDQDPMAQGYQPGSFDVVVSANAVHASTNLRLALRRVRDLLAPGGVLVLVESTTHLAWFDMTTGLIEGWQHFTDDLRTDNPLLPPETWIRALQEEGFEAADAWPRAGSAASALGQHLILARLPGEPFGAVETTSLVDSGLAGTAPILPDDLSESADSLRQRVREALSGDRIAILRDVVRDRVVRILRLDAAEAPGRHGRLMDAGLDSLMAVQLRNQLSQALGLDRPLPASLMFDYPTIESLADHLLARVVPVEVGAPPVGAGELEGIAAAPRAADVAAMTDAEVEALLLVRLGRP